MNVVTPEFSKKKTPEDQVLEIVNTYVPEACAEDEYNKIVTILSDDESFLFLTNLGPADLNLLIDVAKQYVLLGE